MVSLEFIPRNANWSEKDDLLDLKGNVQVSIDDETLPSKFYPDGLKVQVYETSFELIDLLGNLIGHFKDKNASNSQPTFQAEFCYTGNYITVAASDPGNLGVAFLFNPATVDDEELLEGKRFTEETSLFQLATEILVFSISAVNAILDFNPDLENELEELQITILDHTEMLEKELDIQIFPPDEGDGN